MARGGGEEGFRRLVSRDSSSLSYRSIFRPNRMPRVSSRTKTRNIGRDAISGFVYVGSDPRLGSRKKEKKKEKKRRSSLGLDETQSTEVFNDRRSWSAKYGTVGEDRADRVTSGPRCKGRALPG